MKDSQKLELRFWLQLGILVFLTFGVSNFFGLFSGGLGTSEIISEQNFYVIMFTGPIVLIALHFYERASRKKDSKYGTSIGFASQGETPHASFFKRFTAPQIFMASLIIFSILALVNLSLPYSQKAFTGVNYLAPQQFTPGDSFIYNTTLVPGAENMEAAALGGIFMVLVGMWARRRNVSRSTYVILLALTMIIGFSLFGVGNHLLRYSSSDVALLTVAIFWALVGAMTFITGSFLVGYVMHISNNAPLDLLQFLSNFTVRVYIFLFILAMIILYAFIYRGRLFGQKRTPDTEDAAKIKD